MTDIAIRYKNNPLLFPKDLKPRDENMIIRCLNLKEDKLFYIIIFTMTLPFQITLIPNYITMVKLGLVDTFAALIIPFMLNAFAILMIAYGVFQKYFIQSMASSGSKE